MATRDVAAASVAIAVTLPCPSHESAVPYDHNEQADGMAEENGEEEDGMEMEDADVVVMEDNSSINSSINSRISSSTISSAKSRRRSSPPVIDGKRKALAVERIDVSMKDLSTFVNTRVMPARGTCRSLS
eukprot:evm.model.NODE_24733_length_34609_cov_47.236671.1